MENLIVLMKKYDFTEYETKAYSKLLEIGKTTGYDLSKQSLIPRSKIYNVLETLYQKGLVVKTKGSQVYYKATKVDDFFIGFENKVQADFTNMKTLLTQYENRTTDESEVWNIEGRSNIIAKAKTLIKEAESEILMQIWEEDLDSELISLLKDASNKFKKFVLILFSESGKYNLPFDRFYSHHFEKEKLEEMDSRMLNLVVDGKTMILGTMGRTGASTAVTTSYTPMVILSKEYVVHDAYTANILKHLDESEQNIFVDNLSKIRDIY